jgi:membrane-bound serine protease (ClpP class)
MKSDPHAVSGWKAPPSFRRLLALVVALLAMNAFTVPLRGQTPSRSVIAIDVKGAIGVATSEHIAQAITKAESEGAQLLVIKLDTPGGLVSSTREIIKAILASRVPVAVYVSPSGAHAASAGTYIAYAAHIAAMAPGTNIGAATPVQISIPGLPTSPDPKGQPTDKPGTDQPAGAAMERKVLNDAIAFLRSLAQMRSRNADWAEKAVRDAATLTAEEALKERVIEVVARDLPDLLNQIDGRTISTAGGNQRLATKDATVVLLEPTFRIRFLSALADPNIAFILLIVGVYGILFEMYTPGFVGPGAVGGICLLLAFAALTVLPVSYAGLGLLLFGIALMIAEAFTPGIGVLGIGGAVAFVAGALFLFDPAGADFTIRVAWPLIVATALSSALLSVFALGVALKARNRKVATGAEEMIGSTGQVIEWADGVGTVRAHGEVWTARGPSTLSAGQRVRVAMRDGLTLTVEPA